MCSARNMNLNLGVGPVGQVEEGAEGVDIMKIAIPVNEKEIESALSSSFGRSNFYLLYDSETKEATYLENSAQKASGGAGIKAAQIVVDSGAQALISYRCGENAAQLLNEANIKIIRASEVSAKENIDLFLSGKLEELKELTDGHSNPQR